MCVRESVTRTAFGDGVACLLIAGFVLQVLGCCDLSLQEGTLLVQLPQRVLKPEPTQSCFYSLV